MAKKKLRHQPEKPKRPMPKLGWKDHLIYLTVIVLTLAVALTGIFFTSVIRDCIAFSDASVVAITVGEGNIHSIWLSIWCLLVFIPLLGFYSKKIPIFGNPGVSYGPPQHPSIYPIFMKNKPQPRVEPKVKKRKQKYRRILTVVLVSTFLICASLFPLSVCGRSVLQEDGTILVYDEHNDLTNRYTTENIDFVLLDTYLSGGSGRASGHYWHINFEVHMKDAESYRFAPHCFEGSDLQQLQTMLYMKEQVFGGLCVISSTENLHRVIDDQNYNAEESALVYQLFQ